MNDPITLWRERRAKQRAAATERAREYNAERAKENARAAYVAAGGDVEHFDYEWPTLQRRILADKAVEGTKQS
jgi:hypothetical protein